MRAINKYETERFEAIRDAENIALVSTEIDGVETAAIVALGQDGDGMILMHVLAVLVPAPDSEGDTDEWVGAHLAPPSTDLPDTTAVAGAEQVAEYGHRHPDWREGTGA